MDALLASASRKEAPGLASAVDLTTELRNLIENNVTPDRVNHIVTTFEIRPSVVLQVPIHDPVEGANLERQHGPATPSMVQNGVLVRPFRVQDLIMNQPADSPVAQKVVVRDLLNAISAADNCTWTLRSMSRAAHWTFTYICKASSQAWKRSLSKPLKEPVGAWSNPEGQDPIKLARPAFDCRGTVEIAFNKSNRAITIRYEHSPLHTSVGELVERLAPAPAPLEPLATKKAKEPKAPKIPKAPKPPKEPKTPGSSRRKRQAEDGQDGQDGSVKPKKRRKKSDTVVAPNGDESQQVAGMTALAAAVGSMPGETAQNGTQSSETAAPQNNGAMTGAAADSVAAVYLHALPNLPAGEAERRREVANTLLTEANIDPKSLSADQFGIFANQSPELQQESLAMLVRYGAERLQIVHPPTNDSSAYPALPESGAASPSETPVTTAEKVANTTHKVADSTPTAVAVPAEMPASPVEAKPIPTKTAREPWCQPCREKKARCDKGKPSCKKCMASGDTCVYPVKAARKSRGAEPKEIPEPAPDASMDDEPEGLPFPGFHSTESVLDPQLDTSYAPTEPVAAPTDPRQSNVFQASPNMTFSQPTTFGGQMPAEKITKEPTYSATSQQATMNNHQNVTSIGHPAQSPRQSVKQGTIHSRRQSAGASRVAQSTSGYTQGQSQSPIQLVAPARPPTTTSMTRTATPDTGKQSQRLPATAPRQPLPTTQNNQYSTPAPASSIVPPLRQSASRQGYRSQNKTPAQSNSPAPPPKTQPVSRTPLPAYTTESQTQYPAAASNESSGSRIAYEPYSHNPSAQKATYPYYNDEWNAESNGTSNSLLITSSQPMASSYTPAVAQGQDSSQWSQTSRVQAPAGNTFAQGHNTVQQTTIPMKAAYSNQQSGHRQQQSQSTRTNAHQQLRQPQYVQHSQQPRPPQQETYQTRSNTQQSAATAQQQQRQQQNWYGFDDNNSSMPDYNTRDNADASADADYGTGQQQQQHPSMNLTGHTYSAMDANQALYDMFRNN